MYSTHQAQTAYGHPGFALRSDSENEYEIFAKVTTALNQSKTTSASNFPALVKALHDNQILWNRLAGDVSDPQNGLPQTLRAQIFYLAEFVTHHSRLVLNNDANVDALIDINKAIMRGLADSAVSEGAQK